MMSNKSSHKRSPGEEAYAQAFQFKEGVPGSDRDELRDFLYKVAHNLNEAHGYLELLKNIDVVAKDYKSELVLRIHEMGLQCFGLTMRRLTDKLGRRSLQKFTKFLKPPYVDSERKKFVIIYSHYDDFVTKGVAHQDEWSIAEVLKSFPDTKIIENDLKDIESFYYKICNEICERYAKIINPGHDFTKEIKKLI